MRTTMPFRPNESRPQAASDQQFPQEWLLSLLGSAEGFELDARTTVVADYWIGGGVYYVRREHPDNEVTRLSLQGEWLPEHAANNPVAFNDATAFPNVSQALATFLAEQKEAKEATA